MITLLDYTDQTIARLQAARQHASDQCDLRARQAARYDESDAMTTATDVRDLSALLDDLTAFSYAEEQAEADRRIPSQQDLSALLADIATLAYAAEQEETMTSIATYTTEGHLFITAAGVVTDIGYFDADGGEWIAPVDAMLAQAGHRRIGEWIDTNVLVEPVGESAWTDTNVLVEPVGDSTIDAHPAPAVDGDGNDVWHVVVGRDTYTAYSYHACMRLADMLTDAGYHVFTDAI